MRLEFHRRLDRDGAADLGDLDVVLRVEAALGGKPASGEFLRAGECGDADGGVLERRKPFRQWIGRFHAGLFEK